MRYLKNIWKVYILFIFFSCSKEEPKENKEDNKIPTTGTHTYHLTSASTPTPVDMNGKHNTDLFLELPELTKNHPVIIDFDYKRISIFWQEPRINNDRLGILPDRYSDDMLLRFYPTRNFYSYSILDDGTLLPDQSVETLPDGRTFIFPQYVYFQGNTGLTFQTQQKILTKDDGSSTSKSTRFTNTKRKGEKEAGGIGQKGN